MWIYFQVLKQTQLPAEYFGKQLVSGKVFIEPLLPSAKCGVETPTSAVKAHWKWQPIVDLKLLIWDKAASFDTYRLYGLQYLWNM